MHLVLSIRKEIWNGKYKEVSRESKKINAYALHKVISLIVNLFFFCLQFDRLEVLSALKICCIWSVDA